MPSMSASTLVEAVSLIAIVAVIPAVKPDIVPVIKPGYSINSMASVIVVTSPLITATPTSIPLE